MNERDMQNVTNGYETIGEAQYTRPQPRPQSMFEPRDQRHHAHWRVYYYFIVPHTSHTAEVSSISYCAKAPFLPTCPGCVSC